MIEIFIDGDACPVKDEIYTVAARHGLPVALVANARMHVPAGLGVEMVVVEGTPDAADDWIAANVRESDVVVTADIPLAARCLEVGALVLGTNGRAFERESIGGMLATRELKADLRESGMSAGGPPPLSRRDRSRFSNALEAMVQRACRSGG